MGRNNVSGHINVTIPSRAYRKHQAGEVTALPGPELAQTNGYCSRPGVSASRRCIRVSRSFGQPRIERDTIALVLAIRALESNTWAGDPTGISASPRVSYPRGRTVANRRRVNSDRVARLFGDCYSGLDHKARPAELSRSISESIAVNQNSATSFQLNPLYLQRGRVRTPAEIGTGFPGPSRMRVRGLSDLTTRSSGSEKDHTRLRPTARNHLQLFANRSN